MTNYEYLKSLSLDKMAELIEEHDTYKYVANTAYCYEVCPFRVNDACTCEEGNEHCGNISDKECIIAWLNHERVDE